MKTLSKHHIEAIEKAKTEQGKVKAAALAMIETPMDLIKAVLLKHEVAVIEVMCELHQQQQADKALLRQALEALEDHAKQYPHMQKGYTVDAITALRTAQCFDSLYQKEFEMTDRKYLDMTTLREAAKQPLTDEFLRKLHHIDEFGLFCDYDDFEQIARAIEAAHGINVPQARGGQE